MQTPIDAMRSSFSSSVWRMSRVFVWIALAIWAIILFFWIGTGTSERVWPHTTNQQIGMMNLLDTALTKLIQTDGSIPLPSNMTRIVAGDHLIGYQWFIDSAYVRSLNIGRSVPAETYLLVTDAEQSRFQLMTMVRSEDDILDLAADEDTPRYLIVGDLLDYQPVFRGGSLGVLLTPFTHVPVGGSEIDLLTSTDTYLWRLSTDQWYEDPAPAIWSRHFMLNSHLRDDLDLAKTVPHLVGYWKFDEWSGDTVTDHSQYGNHGTIMGEWVTWIEDDHGQGLLFNWAGRVEVPHHDSLNLTDDWMIGIQFKPLDTSVRGTLISKDGVLTWDTIENLENEASLERGHFNLYVRNNVIYSVKNIQQIRGWSVINEQYYQLNIQSLNRKISGTLNTNEIMRQLANTAPITSQRNLLIGRRWNIDDSFFIWHIYLIQLYNFNK
jgi:hypothetical protein